MSITILYISIVFLDNVSSEEDRSFVDGAVIAAARTLPTWSEKDVPMIPSMERKNARELQEECLKMLGEFPTTSQQDQLLLGKFVILTVGAYFLVFVHIY